MGAACVSGLASGASPTVPVELLILGGFFSGLLYSMLLSSGRVTAAAEKMFDERSMHTMELLKNFQGSFKNAMLNLSNAGTNDFCLILVTGWFNFIVCCTHCLLQRVMIRWRLQF